MSADWPPEQPNKRRAAIHAAPMNPPNRTLAAARVWRRNCAAVATVVSKPNVVARMERDVVAESLGMACLGMAVGERKVVRCRVPWSDCGLVRIAPAPVGIRLYWKEAHLLEIVTVLRRDAHVLAVAGRFNIGFKDEIGPTWCNDCGVADATDSGPRGWIASVVIVEIALSRVTAPERNWTVVPVNAQFLVDRCVAGVRIASVGVAWREEHVHRVGDWKVEERLGCSRVN